MPRPDLFWLQEGQGATEATAVPGIGEDWPAFEIAESEFALSDDSPLTIDTNEIVFAPPAGYGNMLKGIPIAYDPEAGQLHVGCILTERIGLVDIASRSPLATWPLGHMDEDGAWRLIEPDFRPKALAWAGSGPAGQLWVVHTSGNTIFKRGTADPVPFGSTGTHELLYTTALASVGITDPVGRLATDPEGNLYATATYIEGCDPGEPFMPLADLLHQHGEGFISSFATRRRIVQARSPGVPEIALEDVDRLQSVQLVDRFRIKDVAFDPTYVRDGLLSGAVVALVVAERQDGRIEQYLRFIRPWDGSSETIPLDPVDEIGVVEPLDVDSHGNIYVATSPNSYHGANLSALDEDPPLDEEPIQGRLLGFQRDAAGYLVELFSQPLSHWVAPVEIACNFRKENELDDFGLTNGLEGRYRSWVDVHEPEMFQEAPSCYGEPPASRRPAWSPSPTRATREPTSSRWATHGHLVRAGIEPGGAVPPSAAERGWRNTSRAHRWRPTRGCLQRGGASLVSGSRR